LITNYFTLPTALREKVFIVAGDREFGKVQGIVRVEGL
jgi:hypothetical protein